MTFIRKSKNQRFLRPPARQSGQVAKAPIPATSGGRSSVFAARRKFTRRVRAPERHDLCSQIEKSRHLEAPNPPEWAGGQSLLPAKSGGRSAVFEAHRKSHTAGANAGTTPFSSHQGSLLETQGSRRGARNPHRQHRQHRHVGTLSRRSPGGVLLVPILLVGFSWLQTPGCSLGGGKVAAKMHTNVRTNGRLFETQESPAGARKAA